jgi:hypothetical protein
MKRPGVLGLAIVLTFGLAVSASQAAKTKKVASLIEIEGTEFVFKGTGSATFFGDVHSEKNKCERGREVTLRNTEPPPGVPEVQGTVNTDHTGDWELEVPLDDLSGGPYVAEVARKKIKRDDWKLVCKAAASGPLVLEP